MLLKISKYLTKEENMFPYWKTPRKKELNLVEEYNDDIKAIWYEITLNKGMNDEIENIKKFLETHGRLKYLKPLYRIIKLL